MFGLTEDTFLQSAGGGINESGDGEVGPPVVFPTPATAISYYGGPKLDSDSFAVYNDFIKPCEEPCYICRFLSKTSGIQSLHGS